jgi:hypothetical protein
VIGTNNGTGAVGIGVYGTQNGSGWGVAGTTPSGIGVNGVSPGGTGVQGTSDSYVGVLGTSGHIGVAGSSSSGTGVYGETGASSDYAIYGNGNFAVSGTKSAVVPAQDGRGHLTLYCMESQECWFEDFGAARLAGGSATVRIDPVFAQAIHTGEYHVFVQAEGQCQGLIVQDKNATGFVVQESGGGASDVPFAYRIVGRRRDVTAPRLNRVTPPKAPAPRR